MGGLNAECGVGTVAALACPHCRAGDDGQTLGLFWDETEGAWRCMLCGHRTFDRRRMSCAEMMGERLWDRIIDLLDRETAGSQKIEAEDDGDLLEAV